MSDAYYHCVSSSKAFGGEPNDYYPVHAFIDRARDHTHSDYHRIFTHHTMGVQDAIREFGPTIKVSTGREVPVRLIANQHIMEDLGFIPTPDELITAFHRGPRGLLKRAHLLMSKAAKILKYSPEQTTTTNN